MNNHHFIDGAFFIDDVGGNYGWPDGDYLTRERIFQDHLSHQLGLMWFLANGERASPNLRAKVAALGLPKEDYLATGGFSHQLSIREARRMAGAYVMTEKDCRGKIEIKDSIGVASYAMDSPSAWP